MNYKLSNDSFKNINTHTSNNINPLISVYDTLVRNMQQAQYPNSKLNEPINNFKLFYPNQNIHTHEGQYFMTNYGSSKNEKLVLNYNSPPMERINIRGSKTNKIEKQIHNKNSIVMMNPEHMKIYETTKHNNKFARPLKTTGSNNLKIINNPCNNISTFNYYRYAPIINNNYIDSPIFNTDLSGETIDLKTDYINYINERSNNWFNSIIDDMNILSANSTNNINGGNGLSSGENSVNSVNSGTNSINNSNYIDFTIELNANNATIQHTQRII